MVVGFEGRRTRGASAFESRRARQSFRLIQSQVDVECGSSSSPGDQVLNCSNDGLGMAEVYGEVSGVDRTVFAACD